MRSTILVRHLLTGALAAGIAVTAIAAEPATSQQTGATIPLTVYGDDPCPKGDGSTIVVCARRPESERYRLPKRFRGEKAQTSPASNAWGNKVKTVEEASRAAANLPDTCSVNGSGGQTGCFHHFLQQSAAERAHDKTEAGEVP